MAWLIRKFSKREIDRAGEILITPEKTKADRNHAIEVVDNWRACHSYPLQIIKMTLLNRAKRVDSKALIAQRLKRRPSIEIKLNDNPHMKLSQMQDIGGCRAVLGNIKETKDLYRQYVIAHSKSSSSRSKWDGSIEFDYISKPKCDGYRSIHLIFRYFSSSREKEIYNGQRIEIQIRSKLQHIWATSVETAQVFTGQALKSKVKTASKDWLRFFALTSSLFAIREKSPLVPDTPTNKEDIINEITAVVSRTNIMESLQSWNNTIHLLEQNELQGADFFLLILDAIKRTLEIRSFSDKDIDKAQSEYDKTEKEFEGVKNIQVVLVSVEDLDELRTAYPNYYVDTRSFIEAVNRETL